MGVVSVAEAVLADEGLRGPLSSIYVSPQWLDGSVCSTLASESSTSCAMRRINAAFNSSHKTPFALLRNFSS